MNYYRLLPFLLLLAACNRSDKQPVTQKSTTLDTFVGTYTRKEGHVDGKGEGIYIFHQDSVSGSLKQVLLEEHIVNPSYLVPSHNGKFVYAVEETVEGEDTIGHVVSYFWNGKLFQKINAQPSHAFAPCHLSTDSQGRYVFVANYVGGVVAMYPIGEDGGLLPASDIIHLTGKGPNPARQEASHPHSANLSPDERYLYVPDLGTDHVNCFLIDYQTGKLFPAEPAFTAIRPGSGPRHLCFHPTLHYAYVISEMSSTITTMQWNANTGELDTLQTISTLPADFKGDNFASDIHITPNGQFLYGANRGNNSIAGYKIDQTTGLLTSIGNTSTHGEFPRNFAISPDGRFLYAANQNTSNIAIFSIESDGKLTYRDEVKTPTPVCVKFIQ